MTVEEMRKRLERVEEDRLVKEESRDKLGVGTGLEVKFGHDLEVSAMEFLDN